MKRKHLLSLCVIGIIFLLGISKVSAQSATATVIYTGAQANGCCTVCGADYWCINNTGGCGTTSACDSRTFTDPIPAGNIATNITINYWSAGCWGNPITGYVNGNVFPTVNEANTSCWCDSDPCALSATTTATFPCGISDYNYGASNTLQLCTGVDICMQRAEVVVTYAPSNQSFPPAAPGGITGPASVCVGSSGTYFISAVTGAATYTWSVPGGWSITSGQGTISITVTAGAGAGSICVIPTNLCGTSGPSCLAVSGDAVAVAPTSATVVPNPFCADDPGNISLTPVGGSGITCTWYTGSCGGAVEGTGNPLSIPSPTTTTTYFCSWTTGCGTSGCASTTVNVNTLPTADAGTSPGTITCSTTSLTLSASGGSTYSWSASGGGNITAGANTATPTINAGGTYTVTVTDGNGCTASDDVVIAQSTTPPTAFAGNDVSICPGTGTLLNATGGNTYSWSPPAGLSATNISNPTASPASTTTFIVTVTDANGCTASDDVTVTISALLNADAGTDIGICQGASATLGASGGTSYSWSPSSTLDNPSIANPVATPASTTTYIVTVTDAFGCTGTDDVIVTVNAVPVANAGSDITICAGSNTTLNAAGGGIYSWSPSTGLSATNISNPVASPATTTSYTVTVTSGPGCTASDDMVVTVNAIPVAEAGLPVTICDNSFATLTASGSANYSWSNGVNTAVNVVSPHVSTTYTVTVSDAIGCSATDDVLVTVLPYSLPVIYTNGPMGFCDGSTDPVILTATNGFISYLWSTGETTQSITVITIGTYWVIATSPNGCSDTVFTQVQNFPAAIAPLIIADGPTDFCEGDVISVNLYTDDPYYAYLWSSGSNTFQIHVTHAGFYSVTVTDSNGCTAASQNIIEVTFIPKPVAYMNYGAYGTFVDFYDYSLNGDTYYWDFGDGSSDTAQNPSHSYAASGEYDVMLIVYNMCGSDTAFVTIRIFSGVGFEDFEYINNFSIYPVPANGTLNIVFEYSDLNALEVKIFNTLGQMMYYDKVAELSGKYDNAVDVNSFVPGIYFLQINTDKGSVNWKIIKE